MLIINEIIFERQGVFEITSDYNQFVGTPTYTC